MSSSEVGRKFTFWVVYDSTGDQQFVKMDSDTGCLTMFGSEESAAAFASGLIGVDYKEVVLYSQSTDATLDKQCRQDVAAALGLPSGGNYAWSYLLQQIKDVSGLVESLDMTELHKLLMILRSTIGGAMWTLDDEEEELAVRTEKAIAAHAAYHKQGGKENE